MQNLRKNMLWNAAGNLIYLGCQWLLTLLVVKIGNFTDAGLLSIAMSVSTVFQTVAMFGIRNFQVSDVTNKYSDTSYVTLRIITCSVALVSCVIFSLVSGYFGEQLLAIILFMLFRLAENFSDVLHGIAQKNDRLDIAGKSFAIKGIGSLAVFVAAFALSKILWVGLLAMTLFSIASTALYDMLIVRRLFGTVFVKKGTPWFPLAKETAALCVYLFLNSAISTVPKLILEKQTSEEILGIYSSIFAPALLISAAASYLYGPFVPSFAESYHKRDAKAFLLTFVKIVAAVLILAVVVIIAAAFLGEFALALLFGEDIVAHAYLLIPILIAIFVSAIFTFLCTLEIVLRDFLWLLISCGIGLVAEIIVTVPWLNASGINGASFSFILGAAIPAVILLVRMLWILLGKRQKGD